MGVPASRESLLAPPGIELRGKLLEAVPIRPTHEDIIRSNVELIRLLLRLETRYVNLRKRFDELFEKLPKVARRIATYCRDDYLANGYDPGEVRFYMIGGRTHFSFEDGY